MVVVGGGELEAELLGQDALRNHAVVGTHAISASPAATSKRVRSTNTRVVLRAFVAGTGHNDGICPGGRPALLWRCSIADPRPH